MQDNQPPNQQNQQHPNQYQQPPYQETGQYHNQYQQPPYHQQPPYGYQGYGQQAGEIPGKGMATISHVLGLVTGFLGPLIIYLMVENDKPFAKRHAAEALNFQITLIIVYILSFILTFLVIGILGFIVFGIMDLIFCITGAVRANNNQEYQYPVSIRFIKL